MKKRLTALLLIAVLTLGLFTACGEGEQQETELPGQVQQNEETTDVSSAKYAYKASYIPLTTHDGAELQYANYFCASGGYVYYVGNYSVGMVTVTDPVTGEAQIDPSTGEPYTYEETEDGLFRMDLETMTVERMEGYQPQEIPEGYQGYSYISDLMVGANGTIWLQEEAYTYTYDLPEDFDEENDDYWNYYTEGERWSGLSQYSSEGEKLQTISLDLGEEVYINQLMMDDQGYIYASDYSQVFLLDSTGALLATLTTEDNWAELAQLSANQIGVISYGETGNTVKLIDAESKDFGEEVPVLGNAYQLMPGYGDYQYLYSDSDNVYGYTEGAETGEKLFSWLDCDIDSNNVQTFAILEDGRVAALEYNWSNSDGRCNLILMEQVNPSTLPQKQELVFGCMYLDYELRPLIVQFNRSHDDVRIVVKDYSEYVQNGNYEDAIQKLNTEILSGAGPDIVAVNELPLEQYAAKGIFVDLWPFIDADQELSRDDLMTNLFDAMSIDGKLYQVAQNFSIQTAAVKSSIAAGRTSWTLDELLEALEELGPEAAIFGETDTKSQMLTQCLSFNLDSFIDWTTGQCSFDSEEFISILEFANSFPLEFETDEDYWMNAESEYSRVMSGKQLMTTAYLSSFDELQIQSALHGGDATFIGYPSETGCGSSFMVYGGLAITSDCADVDAAWSFVRELLLEENQADEYMYQFPTNKHAFETYVEQAMTAHYEIDPETGEPAIDPETGEKIEISTGGIGYGDDFMVELYSMKQEEYDAFMELYESCTNVYSYNDSVMSIIADEAAAYFEGQKTVEETANLIQNRISLYVAEQM